MKQATVDVSEFHRSCDVPIAAAPIVASPRRAKLRLSLLREELKETEVAMRKGDLVQIADGLADLLYVTIGTALEYGIPIDRVFAEVHRSNMTKVDPKTGKVRKRRDGKILKPKTWRPPDIDAAFRGDTKQPDPLRASMIASTAATIVGGDRAINHGPKLDNHRKIADVWNGVLVAADKRPMRPLDAHDVANLMEALKIARRYCGAFNADDYVDGCGYAACAGEIRAAQVEQDRVNATWARAAIEGCPAGGAHE